MSAEDWRKKCEAQWALPAAAMPAGVDWKAVWEAKPLDRNLLKNPAPLGTTTPPHRTETYDPKVHEDCRERFVSHNKTAHLTLSVFYPRVLAKYLMNHKTGLK